MRPSALASNKPETIAGGVGKGVAKVAEGLTTAPNILLTAAGGGASTRAVVMVYKKTFEQRGILPAKRIIHST